MMLICWFLFHWPRLGLFALGHVTLRGGPLGQGISASAQEMPRTSPGPQCVAIEDAFYTCRQVSSRGKAVLNRNHCCRPHPCPARKLGVSVEKYTGSKKTRNSQDSILALKS